MIGTTLIASLILLIYTTAKCFATSTLQVPFQEGELLLSKLYGIIITL